MVGRRRGHRQQLGTDLVGEREVAMALKRGDQLGQEGYEALAADTVRRLPGHAARGRWIAAATSGGWRSMRIAYLRVYPVATMNSSRIVVSDHGRRRGSARLSGQ